MRKGDSVELRMQKVLCIGEQIDAIVHNCTVWRYDEKGECIYFILQSGELTNLSLDAVYGCEIQNGEAKLNCTGRIKERYYGKEGKILKFQIKNGFYKINIKSLTNK